MNGNTWKRISERSGYKGKQTNKIAGERVREREAECVCKRNGRLRADERMREKLKAGEEMNGKENGMAYAGAEQMKCDCEGVQEAEVG